MLDPALLVPERIRPLKRREYERLVDLGVFEGERVELLRGVLVEMSPQGEPHLRISAWFAQCLIRALDRRYEVRSHSSYIISSDSKPEPDVSVSWAPEDEIGPTAKTALLLIEVSGSSLTKDRVIKNAIYAAAGVPEYWIVNVKASTVEVLTRPSKHGYQRTVVKRIGDVLRPQRIRAVRFAVADVPWLRPGETEEPAPVVKKRKRARRA